MWFTQPTGTGAVLLFPNPDCVSGQCVPHRVYSFTAVLIKLFSKGLENMKRVVVDLRVFILIKTPLFFNIAPI